MERQITNQETVIDIPTTGTVDVSLVIPIFNEVESLPHLHKQIFEALIDIKQSWEVVYVDDGSTDGSAEALKILASEAPEHICAISLRRNFGQTAAIAAGIDHAKGEIIVLMDADLQNDPADIPMLLEKIEEGYDLVSGWRKNRKDAFLTRTLPSNIANWLISAVTGVHLHDYGCTLKAYRREIITGFRLYGEMHRFIPAYAGGVGARVTEMVVQHHPRRYGKTKYGLNRIIKVILDLFTVKYLISYMHKPIYLFGGIGISLITAGSAGLIFLVVRKILYLGVIADSPYFLVSTMALLMGFQSILMGLIAEVMVRTYHESQAKPTYNVRWVIRE